jgi:signal-transduction protein with cAMP-binding, CBS, and nucleotidyltransferase domain
MPKLHDAEHAVHGSLLPSAIDASATLFEAARLMSEQDERSLLVVRDDVVLGILTESDLLHPSLGSPGALERTTVEDIVSSGTPRWVWLGDHAGR